VQVLRLYGSLLRDIYRSDDEALQLFNQAQQIEDEATSPDHNNDNRSGAHSVISADELKKSKKKKKRNALLLLSRANEENILPAFLPVLIICSIAVIIAGIVSFVLVSFHSSTLTFILFIFFFFFIYLKINVAFNTCSQTVNTINSYSSCMVETGELVLLCRFKVFFFFFSLTNIIFIILSIYWLERNRVMFFILFYVLIFTKFN
jgi:hypothetical protein